MILGSRPCKNRDNLAAEREWGLHTCTKHDGCRAKAEAREARAVQHAPYHGEWKLKHRTVSTLRTHKRL